jgi:hypothetical protein
MMSAQLCYSLFVMMVVLVVAGWIPSTDAFVGVVPASRMHCPSSSWSRLSVAVDTSEIKNGLTVEIDGEPYKVLSFSIMKQARGAAKTTIKFKNLLRGSTIENTYRSGEKFETALIEKVDAQFTYQEGVRLATTFLSFIHSSIQTMEEYKKCRVQTLILLLRSFYFSRIHFSS